ncbi:MAG: adenosylcobinamide-phosphate synthase CbiB [Cyanobacteria bacterium P01_A01_bin.123]
MNHTLAATIVLVVASSLDYLLGDPWGWLHPVQVMGAAIARYSQWALKHFQTPHSQRIAGIGLGLGLILGSGGIGWILIYGATLIHPWLGIGIQVIMLASCLAGRSLRQAAEAVLAPLADGKIAIARDTLSRYVGRDTQDLSTPDIYRAIMETISENAVDGVLAPLFYALLGAILSGVGSVPLALSYKAASTLDSMVGYRDAPYTYLGWFSARLEDGLTWLPCRLSVLTLALLSGRPRPVLRVCRRDAIADPSPNAGWSECAYAAVLGVQLGGVNRYGGVIKIKPLLADSRHPITPDIIRQAMTLTRQVYGLWLALGLVGLGFLAYAS